jgi:large repetitive protein
MNKQYLWLLLLFLHHTPLVAQNTIPQDSCSVPTIITPNDDGLNDELRIPCLSDNNTDSEIMVFNEWGDRIYFAKPYRNNWRGTYKNLDLPDGTYFYIFKLTPATDAQRGYITIFR